ncbi:MAG: SGNH/GDSL hydrolase family protein [Clostridia bacterium]|nr:SGNH/GDSL hydrolase family protein [Clostridia bacterium]
MKKAFKVLCLLCGLSLAGIALMSCAGRKTGPVPSNGTPADEPDKTSGKAENTQHEQIVPLPSEKTGKAYWKGKTVAYLGDSITALSEYQIYLRRILELGRGYTFAVSGTQLTGEDQSFTQRAEEIGIDTDLIFVLGGTNDFHVGAPLGTPQDPPCRTTFCGAVKLVCETLRRDHPDALIVFATPTRRTAPPGSGIPDKNGIGLSLGDYRQAIIDVCAQYGIPVLDLYTVSRISEETAERYLSDGLHPNTAGFEQMAKEIAAYLCPGEIEY